MPNIPLPDLPGILALVAYRPDTGRALTELAEILLRGDSTLSRGERELIAAYVSDLNSCRFCAATHGAVAAAQMDDGGTVLDQVRADLDRAPVSAKLRALLRIAGLVQQGGTFVTESDVATARRAGASDREVHDTVLIAAAFCMFNRYVDGLGTLTPRDPAGYAVAADRIVRTGYVMPAGAPDASPG